MSNRKRSGAIVIAAVVVEAAGLWFRAHRLAGNVVVRCRQGHLFTTIWIPAVSVKALRLGWWRVQRCPVGHHWSVVTPVDEAGLSGEQRRSAAEHRDIRLP
jgi:hypothetical protein